MTCPTDHKHGDTLTCYVRHKCRCEPCRAARRARVPYERRTRMTKGHDVWIDATGIRRRLQALAVAGWAPADVSERCGSHYRHLTKIRSGDLKQVRISTARRIEPVYRELIMQVRDDRAAKITKFSARRNGWVPALAWNDIDRDAEPVVANNRNRGEYDPIAVELAASGQPVNNLNQRETREVVKRLHAQRWPDTRIGKLLSMDGDSVCRI